MNKYMAIVKKSVRPRRRFAKKSVRPRRRYIRKRSSNNVPEYASLSCKRTLVPQAGGNFAINNLYSLMNTQLVDYARAVQVAQAYQHYRIKKITVTFKPTFDTFVNNGATTQSKMHLYFMIDKAGSIPTNVTLEGLKQMGARPFALDENERKVTWAPSVLESSMYQPGVGNNIQSKYIISPWLSTNANPATPGGWAASGIDHLGLYWYCEQLLTPGVTPYEVEVEVQFQFKKPLSATMTGAVEAKPAAVAELNNSSDGIVGGPDGE